MTIDWEYVALIHYHQLIDRFDKCSFIAYDKLRFKEFHRFALLTLGEAIAPMDKITQYIGVFVSEEELEQIRFMLDQLGITPTETTQ